MSKVTMEDIENEIKEMFRISNAQLQNFVPGNNKERLRSIKSAFRQLEMRIKILRINIRIFELQR